MQAHSDIRGQLLETLCSQWRELGLSSPVPLRHADDCIDPDPLIAFTAVHGDLDPRLREESIDLVLRYGTYVSKARLKNVLADQGLLDNVRFGEYAATVNANGGAGWPAGQGEPLPLRPRARAVLDDLSRPALLSLRIRAIFGIGARAELIRVFLAHPNVALTAADLSAETSYGKRNVLNELEPLRLGGVVKSFRAVNADRFSLVRRDEVAALVHPLPKRFTAWTPMFAALHLVLELVIRPAKRGDLQNAVDAVHLLAENQAVFVSAGIDLPRLPAGTGAWQEPKTPAARGGRGRGDARRGRPAVRALGRAPGVGSRRRDPREHAPPLPAGRARRLRRVAAAPCPARGTGRRRDPRRYGCAVCRFILVCQRLRARLTCNSTTFWDFSSRSRAWPICCTRCSARKSFRSR